jgi:rare lipoprotein A
MNQKNFLTVVALSSTVLGMPSVSRAETATEKTPVFSTSSLEDLGKVRDLQSLAVNPVDENRTVTKIHSHSLDGKQAATLYVRTIPVFTFIGSELSVNEGTKIGSIQDENLAELASLNENDPVKRAGVVAAKVNQLVRENADASKIIASWKKGSEKSSGGDDTLNLSKSLTPPEQSRYIIKINNEELVEINNTTRLANGTNNPAEDALQAANRLRRLVGKASPLTGIANVPSTLPVGLQLPEKLQEEIKKAPQQIARGRVSGILRGWASFYGYDGSSSATASGQRFNPESMTAAHRSLPFGTRVRVTNTHNGRSVVVRINDRGPFIRGRVIDLSFGAARVLGMISNGVAPVRIEILGR